MFESKDFVEIAVVGSAVAVKLAIDETLTLITRWLRGRKRAKQRLRLFVRTNSIRQLEVVEDQRIAKERRQRTRRQPCAPSVPHADNQEKRIAERRTFTRRAMDRRAAA